MTTHKPHHVVLVMLALCTSTAFSQDTAWPRHVVNDELSGADGVRIADVNGDSLMDITTGFEEGGVTKVFLHPGYTRVKEPWPSVTVGVTPDVEDAVFADLDNDGAVDVISSTEGKTKKIFINWAPQNPDDYLDSQEWNSQAMPASDGLMRWMFAYPMQVDDQYGQDIIAGAKNPGGAIGWFEAPENPRIMSDWTWHTIYPATWIMSIFLRDMDHDGDIDIVSSDRKPGDSRGVRWIENPGPGPAQKQVWKNHFMGAQDREVMFMDMADLDDDGLEDAMVTAYPDQQITYLRRLDETGLNWETHEIDLPETSGRAKAIKVGDIDGDGSPDLVHSSNTLKDPAKEGILWASVKTSVTDRQWTWHSLSGPEGYKFDRIELLDMDGDGDLDVLTCEENYGEDSHGLGVIWYENP